MPRCCPLARGPHTALHLEGDAETGVSIMRIGHGVDTGAYCAQASCTVADKTSDELTAELAELGGDLLVSTLPAIADGSAVWTEQDESLVTHAAKIAKAELRLDPAAGALENTRRVMASFERRACALRDRRQARARDARRSRRCRLAQCGSRHICREGRARLFGLLRRLVRAHLHQA